MSLLSNPFLNAIVSFALLGALLGILGFIFKGLWNLRSNILRSCLGGYDRNKIIDVRQILNHKSKI
ncbi:MAG: hypothetical protein ACKVOQ_12375 [Cyclobacteriaceae bacterium]